MVVVITHVKKRGNRIIEIGEKLGRIEIWRKTANEAIALYRAGMRFVLKPKDGEHAVEVIVQPSTLQTDAELRTVADKAFDRKLLALPELD